MNNDLPKPDEPFVKANEEYGYKRNSFQTRVGMWLQACFGTRLSTDKNERNHRFLEEALELVQACGCTKEDAHTLVDYVYGRPIGEPLQELGGTMLSLHALANAHRMNVDQAAEVELERVWHYIPKIRAKRAMKPEIGPLP